MNSKVQLVCLIYSRIPFNHVQLTDFHAGCSTVLTVRIIRILIIRRLSYLLHRVKKITLALQEAEVSYHVMYSELVVPTGEVHNTQTG